MNMKEINYDFSRQNARNNQHVNFATNALAAFPEEVAEAQGFAELRSAFATAVDDEVLCFQPDKSYMDTPEVEETDLTRDSTYLFYKHLALTYADYCPDAEKRAHGKTLAFAFDNEGDVTRAEYTGETAMLADLADKLRQEPYAAALTALGIDDAPDQIDAANDAFNQVYMRRAAEMEGRATSFNMKALRPRTDDAFNELAKAVNALYAVNELVTKDEVQAAVLHHKLPRLDADNERRRRIAERYMAGIRNPLVALPEWREREGHVFHIFAVRCKQRDALQAYLAEQGIQTLIHYPVPPHKQEAYREWNDRSYPITERIHREELSLPVSPVMAEAEADAVIDAINRFSPKDE